MIPNIIFIAFLLAAIVLFYKNVSVIVRNINIGKDIDLSDNKIKRWKLMFKVTIFQSKMVSRPISGILHIFVYVGFIIVNFEMLEIIFDGISGSHRLFSFTGPIYSILISTFEFFALSVIIACIIFLARRNLFKVKRF
ncbi:MAG: hypothetical protein K8S16_02625, partial [Bacteroidales bacterium]|nr:hypothetical protein [Bacteroidales bacterium]